MMTEQERIERFLQLQEQAGQMTDEELQQALNDSQLRELAEQVAFAKRAFKNEELKVEEPDVDQEWEKFLAQSLPTPVRSGVLTTTTSRRWMKMAASFIGILLVSGIAFAAIWKHAHPKSGEVIPYSEKIDVYKQESPPSLGEAGEGADTVPVVFDNVSLDTMLADMTAYYGVEVVFKNDATRQLRFHFVWKREDGLNRAVEKLNRFESLAIRLEDNKIIVE